MTVLDIITYTEFLFCFWQGILKPVDPSWYFGGLQFAFVGLWRRYLEGFIVQFSEACLVQWQFCFQPGICRRYYYFLQKTGLIISGAPFLRMQWGWGYLHTAGIEVAKLNGSNDLYALVMGVIIATFGGLIADIFVDYPMLLRRASCMQLYVLLAGLFILQLISFSNFYNDIQFGHLCDINCGHSYLFKKKSVFVCPIFKILVFLTHFQYKCLYRGYWCRDKNPSYTHFY